jgi:hypothetical protein
MLNRFGITYLGHTLPLLLELAFLFLFGALMLAIAVLTFRVQE